MIEVYGESCMDIKSIRKWCREFAFGRTEIHDEKLSGRQSTCKETVVEVEKTMHNDRRVSLDDLCVSIPEVSLTTIYRISTASCNIGRCAQDGSHECWQKTTNGNEWTLPVNFSAAIQTKNNNFLDSIVTVDETRHTTSDLRQNSKQISGCIPLRLSCKNLSTHSLPVKSLQLCFGIERGHCWPISWLLGPQ